jgi:hypothetical protein
MSRFKRIKNKTTKKSSVSIDEKIAALNKELKKTNMLSEVMTTSNVYSTSTNVPADPGGTFPVPDPNGVTQTGFTPPVSGNPDDPSNWPDAYTDNSWMFNPNEVDGESNRPVVTTMDQGVLAAYNAANPGSSNFPTGGAGIVFGASGFGTGVGYAKGGHFYQVLNPGLFGDGSTKIVPPGSPFSAPWFGMFGMYFPATPELAAVVMAMSGAYAAAGGFTKDSDKVMSIPLWRNHNLFHDGPFNDFVGKKYTDSEGKNYILQTFFMHRAGNTYFVNPTPESQTNVQTRGTEDPPIYPGPIANLFGLGARAYEWLFGRAKKEKEEKDYERNRRNNRPKPVGSKPEPDPIPEPDSSKSEPDPEKDYERNRYNNRPKPVGSKPEPDPIPEPDPSKSEPDPEKDYERNRRTNRPKVTGGGEAEELLQNAVATMLDFTDNPIKYAVQGLLNLGGLLTGQDGLATSFNNVVHHTNNNNPLHPDFRKNDPSSDNYEGPVEVQTSDENRQNIVNNLNKIISNLNGGKGPKNPNGNLTNKEIDKLSDEMKKNYYNDPENQANNTFYNSFHSLPTGGDRGDGKPVTTVTVKDGKFEKLDSNYWFDNPRDANPLASDESIPSNDKQLPSTVISNIIHGVESQAIGNGVWTSGSDGNPFYSDETKTTVVGTQYNTQQSFSAKPPKSNKNVKESYITESVALGHFEPVELNVDIEDLRKGIMPEYPKNPPAEMIDGYHEKSRIRSKNAKNEEPYLKIDKTDLIRNHRLKSSEADEMMDTINMINDYIKKHPEDWIHAQMRYPVDDPRLAELNWKMDQMLNASKDYLDSNFKVNEKLFKRAVDRTKNNIKLTDPEYVQQNYNELRGTTQGKVINPKPRDIKLKSKIKKYLPQYESKGVFKYVDSKDFKKISERKEEQKRLKLANETILNKITKERQEYIDDEMSKQKSDWRQDILE